LVVVACSFIHHSVLVLYYFFRQITRHLYSNLWFVTTCPLESQPPEPKSSVNMLVSFNTKTHLTSPASKILLHFTKQCPPFQSSSSFVMNMLNRKTVSAFQHIELLYCISFFIEGQTVGLYYCACHIAGLARTTKRRRIQPQR
jgi:hypothetical protein